MYQPESTTIAITHTCYHCGKEGDHDIKDNDKFFCCDGCKMVYQLLQDTGLCQYYELSSAPGITVKGRFHHHKFEYLDSPDIRAKLIHFSSGDYSRVNFYLPSMHCASCVWLLEQLNRIEPAVAESVIQFQRKEISVLFNHHKLSLRRLVELLAYIGYEPYISLADANGTSIQKNRRAEVLKIGVAGFCFGNIMMLSFPDYFSGGEIGDPTLEYIFPYLSLALALPVFFFSASPFFQNAWSSYRQKQLHIDTPIALAILVTFLRSVYEILSHTGSGYLDSMSGTVFFMLVGRWFQQKTYHAFSFDRDYKAYFPLGAIKLVNGEPQTVLASDLSKEDLILVRNEEMVPADGLLMDDEASVDYSFVSGEQEPVTMHKGDLIYAGGKIIGTAVTLKVNAPTRQSHITQLWNRHITGAKKNQDRSFIHPLSKYFTWVLFSMAGLTAFYWALHDANNILPAVSATLIVACPCFLLMATTFTYGNMMRIFGLNHLYLKNPTVLEALTQTDTIIFDKTGTLTMPDSDQISYGGEVLTAKERSWIYSLAAQSTHPLSRLIVQYLKGAAYQKPSRIKETAGAGIEGFFDEVCIQIGNSKLTGIATTQKIYQGTFVQVMVNGEYKGSFQFHHCYREGLSDMIAGLPMQQYQKHILSGDHPSEKDRLTELFGKDTPMHFECTPIQKLEYVEQLSAKGHHVLMIGDGLNDAGALYKSHAGMAVSDGSSRFSPDSDAIVSGKSIHKLHRLLSYARSSRTNISIIFGFSIIYNVIGLYFAVRGELNPMIAAILMPTSTITIVSLSWLLTTISARKRGL